jgi:predicted amidophosphoribosyltransferase
MQRFVNRHLLGLAPDPESWPPPDDFDSLPLSPGREKSGEILKGWVLDREFGMRWPHRRTVIGAQAYRFEANAEYDCGSRLVDLAGRFLDSLSSSHFDILMLVPPPQIFRPVNAVEWAGERLSRRLGAAFRPDLLVGSAPLNDHADRLRKLPVPWGDLYRLTRPESVFNKRILLVDWRWEKGKTMTALSKLLRHAGAEVVCFAWME